MRKVAMQINEDDRRNLFGEDDEDQEDFPQESLNKKMVARRKKSRTRQEEVSETSSQATASSPYARNEAGDPQDQVSGVSSRLLPISKVTMETRTKKERMSAQCVRTASERQSPLTKRLSGEPILLHAPSSALNRVNIYDVLGHALKSSMLHFYLVKPPLDKTDYEFILDRVCGGKGLEGYGWDAKKKHRGVKEFIYSKMGRYRSEIVRSILLQLDKTLMQRFADTESGRDCTQVEINGNKQEAVASFQLLLPLLSGVQTIQTIMALPLEGTVADR